MARTVLPWLPVIRPTIVIGDFERGRVVPFKQPGSTEGMSAGTVIGLVVLFVVNFPSLLLYCVLAVLTVPLMAVELIVLGIGAVVLAVLRRAGRARYQVQVTRRSAQGVHVRVMLLVRGDRKAVDAVITDLRAQLPGTVSTFNPRILPANVTIQSHKAAPILRSRKRRA